MLTYVCTSVLLLHVIAALTIPPSWQPAVERGDMLFSKDLASNGYMPRISNGRLGIELFLGCNYGEEGMIYSTGVFNGYLNVTPSDAAAIPSPWLTHWPSNGNSTLAIGGAMDLQSSMYRN